MWHYGAISGRMGRISGQSIERGNYLPCTVDKKGVNDDLGDADDQDGGVHQDDDYCDCAFFQGYE